MYETSLFECWLKINTINLRKMNKGVPLPPPCNYKIFINYSILITFSMEHLNQTPINPFVPTVAFNIRCPRDCVSRHNGGTAGAPLKPLRDDCALRALSSLRGLRGINGLNG